MEKGLDDGLVKWLKVLQWVTCHYIKLLFASDMTGVHGDQALIMFSITTQYNTVTWMKMDLDKGLAKWPKALHWVKWLGTISSCPLQVVWLGWMETRLWSHSVYQHSTKTLYHGQRWALAKAWRSGRRYFTVWLATISSSPLQAVWLGCMVHGDQADHNQNNNTVQHHYAQQQHKQASSAGTQDSLTHSSPCPLRQVWSQLRRAGCCVARTSPLWHALTWPNHPACRVQ